MMKPRTTSTRILKLGWIAFFLIVAVLTLLLSSFTARKAANDVWQILGLSQQDGQEKIKSSFLNGYLYYYGVRNLRNIAVNDRKAVAKDLLDYTRSYVSSPAFKKAYEQLRAGYKPVAPTPVKLRTIAEIQKEEIAKNDQAILSTEKNMKDFPQYAKSMETVLAMLKKNQQDYKNPANPLFASIAQGEKSQQDYELEDYNRRMKTWETNYPAEVDAFIAAKLDQMLTLTADIDYGAELVEKWGKKRFVNPVYESKRPEWKLGYRAGKEVTGPAREFARLWLEDLKKKK